MRVFGRAADTKMTRTEDQARDSARRRLQGEDFVRCEDCGAYTSKSDPCACKSWTQKPRFPRWAKFQIDSAYAVFLCRSAKVLHNWCWLVFRGPSHEQNLILV